MKKTKKWKRKRKEKMKNEIQTSRPFTKKKKGWKSWLTCVKWRKTDVRKGEDEGRKSRVLKFLSLRQMIERTWKNTPKRHDISRGSLGLYQSPTFELYRVLNSMFIVYYRALRSCMLIQYIRIWNTSNIVRGDWYGSKKKKEKKNLSQLDIEPRWICDKNERDKKNNKIKDRERERIDQSHWWHAFSLTLESNIAIAHRMKSLRGKSACWMRRESA